MSWAHIFEQNGLIRKREKEKAAKHTREVVAEKKAPPRSTTTSPMLDKSTDIMFDTTSPSFGNTKRRYGSRTPSELTAQCAILRKQILDLIGNFKALNKARKADMDLLDNIPNTEPLMPQSQDLEIVGIWIRADCDHGRKSFIAEPNKDK